MFVLWLVSNRSPKFLEAGEGVGFGNFISNLFSVTIFISFVNAGFHALFRNNEVDDGEKAGVDVGLEFYMSRSSRPLTPTFFTFFLKLLSPFLDYVVWGGHVSCSYRLGGR